MIGKSNPHPSMFFHINLEQLVSADHSMHKNRPLIDTDWIRQLCESLYSEVDRTSIPHGATGFGSPGRLSMGRHMRTRLGVRAVGYFARHTRQQSLKV
jgi:hypothetical protein